MASSFQGWGASWAQTWERISNPNAMYGSVVIRFTATGDLSAPSDGFISGSAGLLIGATGVLGTGLTQYPVQQGGGPGRQHYFEKTSRNSDSDAYNQDRVSDRLQAVVINGKEYNPFDQDLISILEAEAAKPAVDDTLDGYEQKMNRTFTVLDSKGSAIKVPMYRPMLPEMPDLKKALATDMATFAAKAKAAADENMRRVILLLDA